MRITQKLMTDNFLTSLNRQTQKLYQAQERVATGKRINRASDDPVGMGRVLNYRTALSSLSQYRRNIERARGQVEASEAILNTVDEMLVSAKGIAVQQASGNEDAASRQTAADQVDLLRNQIIGLANSRVGGRYLYGGRDTDSAPFSVDAGGDVTYVGDNTTAADTRYVVSQGVEVAVKANGAEIFTGAQDAFALLKTLQSELASPAPDLTVLADMTGKLQEAIDQVRTVRADSGTVSTYLEATTGQLDRMELNLENLRGGEEDADIPQVAMELKVQETVYESTLAVAAQILPKSLVKFLA